MTGDHFEKLVGQVAARELDPYAAAAGAPGRLSRRGNGFGSVRS